MFLPRPIDTLMLVLFATLVVLKNQGLLGPAPRPNERMTPAETCFVVALFSIVLVFNSLGFGQP